MNTFRARYLVLLLVMAVGCSPAADSGDSPAAVTEAPAVLIPAPDLEGLVMVDQDGADVVFDTLRDRPALLTFIYTRCPMPEMCPATMLRMQEVQKALSPEQRQRVRLIAVSFDPLDTPEVLAEYGELWEADTTFFSLLTGAPENVQKLAGSYGAWFEKAEGEIYDHTMMSLLLNGEGSVVEIMTGSAWDSAAAAASLVSMADAEADSR